MAIVVQWDEKYSVRDETIDAEHQKLFELANVVFAIANPAQDEERFRAAVKRLFKYAEYHFRHEEELMAKVDFPDRTAHSNRHTQIIARLQDALRSSKSQVELSDNLRHLMLDWVLKHIMEEDSKIAASVAHAALFR
jgi:hemerythrin